MTTATELEAGPELDRLVAEKVMGLKIAGPECRALRFVQMGDTLHPNHVYRYSTEMAHAWGVVERTRAQNGGTWVWTIEEEEQVRDGEQFGWRAEVLVQGVGSYRARALTAPLAICRAAMKAISA